MIPIDQLIRSRRKTVALIVEPDGRLVVRAPLRIHRSSKASAMEDWRVQQACVRVLGDIAVGII